MRILNLFTNKLFTFVVCLAFVIYVGITLFGQSATMKDNQVLLENYQTNIDKQQELQKELGDEEKMIGTDAFTEKIARDRLGLCKSSEKIFVDGKGE